MDVDIRLYCSALDINMLLEELDCCLARKEQSQRGGRFSYEVSLGPLQAVSHSTNSAATRAASRHAFVQNPIRPTPEGIYTAWSVVFECYWVSHLLYPHATPHHSW